MSAHTPSRTRSNFAASLINTLTNARHLAFSMLVHVIIIIVFGGVVLYKAQEETADFLGSSENLLISPTPSDTPPISPVEKPQEVSVSSPTTSQAGSSSPIEVMTTTGNSSFKVNSSQMLSSVNGLGDGAGGSGKSGLAGMGGLHPSQMGGGTMRFMGTEARGQSVVFVVDVSGSMIRGSGKSERTYEQLEREVIRFLQGLELKQSFGLVAFSKDARYFRPNLVRATSDDKQRAISWLKKLNPDVLNDPRAEGEEKEFHHGTRADRGLETAFAMQPDVIFFISDGEPTGGNTAQILAQVEIAQQQRNAPAVVHTIAYLADSGQAFMRTLAEKNFGTFREINPGEVKREK